ncbi:MAG: hypothetical protein ACI8SR_000855 [Oceanicoccus sp.]|jgi:hypothetical protein
MGALLLRLKHVPEDEYQEVCDLLNAHDLAYYETTSGFWGVGMAAIWLNDAAQLPKAHDVLNDYMRNRQMKMQADFEQAQQQGESRTLSSTFAAQPVTFVLYVLAVIGILALSILPFLGLL